MMPIKAKLNILSAAILAAAGNGVYAQTVDELSTTVIQAASESSVSPTITDLNAEEISRTSISNIEDTTRYVPGVQVNDSGNRFGDNGFNIRGLEGDAVAVTVDGISLGETLAPASFSAYGMYDSNRGQVELEHVKSIRITKGPSSVANGSNALAGSVAYTTHDAGDFLNVTGNDSSFGVKTGYDSRSEETMANVTLANRTGGLESLLQYTRRDGHESASFEDSAGGTGAEREVADEFSREVDSILAKVSYEFAEGQSVGILYDRTDRTTTGNPLSRNSSTYFVFDTDDDNNKERYGVFYRWNNANNLLFDSLSASVDMQEVYTSGVTSFGYSSGDESYLRREDRNTTQDSTSFNLDLEKWIAGDISQTIRYGVKWESKSIDNVLYDRRYQGLSDSSGYRKNFPERDASWVPETDTDVFNVYVSDDIQLTDALLLRIGGRYDSTQYSPNTGASFEDVSGNSVVDSEFNAFAGEVVVEYQFLPGQTLLASYSQGYKAPSAQQLYLGTDGSESIQDSVTGVNYVDLDTIANPDLEAEESSSIELGYKLATDRASVTITGYWTTYENRIQQVALTSAYDPEITTIECQRDFTTGLCSDYVTSIISEDEYSQAQNVGEVDVHGIEIDATYAITNNLFTQFTYATIDGEYQNALEGSHEKGDELETAAPDSATLTFGYQANNDRWGLALHSLWFDQVDESDDLSYTSLNNGEGPAFYPESYTVFDLTAFYNITDNLSLTAGAYNITDKEYYRWEVINSVRNGFGGFFGGVAGDGYKRYSEPGRSFSLNVAYVF